MWHSLSGLMETKDDCLDLARCFPVVRGEYQASCTGAAIRAMGAGALRLELKSADGRVLWWSTEEVPLGDEWQELCFVWDPAALREVKSLHWTAEPGALIQLDALSLIVRLPDLPLEEELFLLSYTKLARLYSAESGTVRERALRPVGERDAVVSAGFFCLATSLASKLGMVKQAQAEQILHKVSATIAELPTAAGLLPSLVSRQGGRLTPCEGALYSTLDTSLCYHSLLLAAQLLWDGKTLAHLITAIRQIDFDRLLDAEGYATIGIEADGQDACAYSWRNWGGETTLVQLLEHMATGSIRTPRPNGAGVVAGGVGTSAELPGLFYPDFSTEGADAVAGVDWLGARRSLLQEQTAYFPRKRPRSAAARLGLYGLSVGEDPHGEGLIAGGTRTGDKQELIRPHYVLMSGLVGSEPEAALEVMRTLKERGLVLPWGIVGGFSRDLDHAPLVGSFTAGLECLGAYHLLAGIKGEPDLVHAAVEDCGLLREAVRVFYPQTKTW